MKKLIIAAMTAAIASASCTKEITSYQTDNCEIYATIEHENKTKTLLDENNDILWTAADQIAAFLKSPSAQCFQIQDKYVGKNQGYFSEVSQSGGMGGKRRILSLFGNCQMHKDRVRIHSGYPSSARADIS